MDLTTLASDRIAQDGSDELTRRVVASQYRLLARGRPVEPRQVAAYAGVALSDVDEVLQSWGGTRRDDDGHVTAFGGLDLEPTAHRMTVNGTRLFTWCAWDTLFIPLILGTDVTVESRSPGGETVTLFVGADGVRSPAPATAVLSLVRPPRAGSGDVRDQFCSQVHLFPDEASGHEWAAGREEVSLVTLDEGARLGRRHAEAVIGDLAGAGGTPAALLLTLAVEHDPPAGLVLPETAEGEPVGSGSGRVGGSVVNGSMRWALSERVGDDVCAMDLFAVIDTTDGAKVEVEGQGFARLRDGASSRWEVSGALRLTSADPRYAWLGDQLAFWDGESDLSTGTASWKAWLRP